MTATPLSAQQVQADAKGNPLTITDADNKVTRFFYNAQGLLTVTRDALYPTNPATTFTYDTLGRLLTTTDPLNRTTTLTYNNAGDVATSKDHLNRITSFEYDAKNRLKKVTDPLNGITQYSYDGNGNLLTVKDAKNQITTFAYDSRNRLISSTDPLNKVETYEYDGNDNLTKRITPKMDQIVFAYDAVNQLLSKTLPGTLATSYTYDAVGNLLTVTDPDSALTMTYDQANRLLTTSTAGSLNQPSVTLTYAYDKNGNRLTLADGTNTNTATYDPLNRLASLTSPAGANTFAYDALSRRTSLTLPNGTQTTYTYDPASQVQQILHKLGATGPTINQAAYTYNGVGNRESLTDRRGIQNFGYDNLDRLTSASHPLLGTAQSFAYDPVGNRTTAGNVTNAGNQLTADATHSYQYDDNGNLTRKTLLATGTYAQYTYDAENRLTKVEDFVAGNPTPSFTSTYRYDGLGRRIEKVANGQTKRYIYDGEDILLEYDGTNTLQARYTHGPGIDEPIAVTKGSSTYFYHQDGLGSVTDLTDSAGATAKSYAYDAYGNILESPGTLEQPYTYTGRELDSESGLYYYRARYYDPASGRFLQKDPLGLRNGEFTLYAYVLGNPTNLIDPLGLYTPGVHKRITEAALAGIDQKACRQFSSLPELVANVDFSPSWLESQRKNNAHMHGMAAGKEDRDVARSRFGKYIGDNLASCTVEGLARSLHAVQDSTAEGHRNFQPYNGIINLDISHLLNDMFPSPNNEVAGRVLSMGILGQYLEKCPCSCGK